MKADRTPLPGLTGVGPNFDLPFYPAYWVIPEKLMAGCYPAVADAGRTQRRLQGLLDLGIDHIVDLMESREMEWRGKAEWAYADRFIALGKKLGKDVYVEQVETQDGWIPSKKRMKKTLDYIDQAINHGGAAYVHCFAGRGRTGTVVGCYLARHGYARGREILTMIHRLRKHAGDSWPSPENPTQLDFVLSWNKGE